MIVGIGVDIAEISRFEKIIERYAERFSERILCETERQQFEHRNHSASFLASRFAAKEAISKALGTGIAEGIGFHDLEIINNDLGKPDIRFHGQARIVIEQRGIRHSFLSLSDEKHYAVAMVVLESD